jgi:protein-S-isoprenylcysteine O-methyltransferase Ste14
MTVTRWAVTVFYLVVTVEMIFMVTPFALYYYSAYSPLLGWLDDFTPTSWMLSFFLPHLSTFGVVLSSVGGLIFLLGLTGFFFNAAQLYYTKLRRRGLVQGWFYRRVRHPQYLFLAVAGFGLILVWPRFILLIAFLLMLLAYYALARHEEQRMKAAHADLYAEYASSTAMFLPGEPGGRLGRRLFGWIKNQRLQLAAVFLSVLVASCGSAFLLRIWTMSLVPVLELPGRKTMAVPLVSKDASLLRELIEIALDSPHVQGGRTDSLDGWRLVHVTEGNWQALHLLIDAGMTIKDAQKFVANKPGLKLIFSRPGSQISSGHPFSLRSRWRPFLMIGIEGRRVGEWIQFDEKFFSGSPGMPVS